MSIYPANTIPEEGPPVQPPVVRLPSVTPTATYVLMAISIGVYLLQVGSEVFLGTDLPVVLAAKINSYIRAGELWRLITPVFLHASILHIGLNMYALLVIGSEVERFFGRRRFLLLYFLAGFAGNVFSFLFSSGVSVGASTAIFGLLAAQGVLLYQNRALLGRRARRSLNNLIVIAAINLFIGLSPGIDNWGHVGGLLGGLLFAWFTGPRWELTGVHPFFELVDQREARDVLVGAALVVLVFGALTLLGMR